MTDKPIIKFPKCFCFADKNVKTSCDGKIIRLGTYRNKEDAIAARKRADILYEYENGLDK